MNRNAIYLKSVFFKAAATVTAMLVGTLRWPVEE
jgi:hypothetical protein